MSDVVLHAVAAAAALFAGLYFLRVATRLLVPVGILAITDLALLFTSNLPVLIATYAIMTVPVFLGRLQRGEESRWRAAGEVDAVRLVPVNVVLLRNELRGVGISGATMRSRWVGLLQCYWAAVPFFRWMIAGDVFYLATFSSARAVGRSPEHRGSRAACLRSSSPATRPARRRSSFPSPWWLFSQLFLQRALPV